jgi:hypothetical protein
MIALAAVALLALAGNAMATDVTYYPVSPDPGYIYAGQFTPVGTMTAVMHYTADNNATLEIHYATDAGWQMNECHLQIATVQPASRGAPGQYAYSSGTISTNSYSFNIPIADLISDFGINWESDVYVMPHCALTWVGSGNPPGGEAHPTGFGGCIVKPKKGSWFGFFAFDLTKPEDELRQPYIGGAFGCNVWESYWCDQGGLYTPEDVENYLPVTLAGEYLETAAELFGMLSLPGENDAWNWFLVELAALHCNTIAFDGFDTLYYDDPNDDDEFMGNKQISYIMSVANGYRENHDPADPIVAMKDVLWAINYNSSQHHLWYGPQGRSVPLGQTARLAVSPNPFTGSTRIRLQNSPQSEARVSVYDLSGKKVNELTCNQVWNGTDARGQKLAAGVYLLRLVGGTQSVSARAVISR